MNGFAPEEVTQRGADPAAGAAVVGNAGSAVEVPPPPPAPPGLGLTAAAAASTGAGSAGGPGAGQLCCLREEGERCGRAAGNASFSKRIQKSISQKKVKIELDKSVDLYQLQVNTLRRYKRHFKLQTRPGLNKAQLVEIIGCHFRTIPVNEKDTLTYFIYSVKNDKNKTDLKMDSGVH
ncbi:histone deacetylase complex subunit SAP30 isoform X2 [Dryobates pubescens]|uniref:histone deacetylase complex subunit SAP30 isoform X2 n=1 Tax=Dryobates pubescens TaxID=118200 RepID=UPI0023BA31D7|nr:histone deacetylase complex subunit SAP30 isoform X2 [Dryobates pubescens]